VPKFAIRWYYKSGLLYLIPFLLQILAGLHEITNVINLKISTCTSVGITASLARSPTPPIFFRQDIPVVFKYEYIKKRKTIQNPRRRPSPLKMGPLGCPETSVRNYHCKLRNIPEERRSHLLRGGSLISQTFQIWKLTSWYVLPMSMCCTQHRWFPYSKGSPI
jgi:hypothetical protein